MRFETILALLMLSSSSLAALNIVSPIPDYTYFSNEEIQVLGSIGFENCSGTAALLADGNEMGKAFLEKGVFYKLEDLFSNSSFRFGPGEHYVTITTDCGDRKTVYFKVREGLSIVYSTNGNSFMTGDVFKISAYAFRKEKITNITSIIIGNSSFVDHASVVLKSPGDLEIVLRARDDEGYSGEEKITLHVFDKLKLETAVEKKEINPDEEENISVLCFDAFGKMRRCNASVYWFGEWVSSGSLIVPSNASPGEHAVRIIASNGSNIGEGSISITVLRKAVIKDIIVDGNEFEVISTDQNGNSFNTEINVSFFDSNGGLVKEQKVITNNKYELNLPPGIYYIATNASGKSFEKKAVLGNSEEKASGLSGFVVAKKRATLIAGLIIIALTIIAVFLQRKKK